MHHKFSFFCSNHTKKDPPAPIFQTGNMHVILSNKQVMHIKKTISFFNSINHTVSYLIFKIPRPLNDQLC